MLLVAIWFICILLTVLVLYLFEGFIRSLMPGYNKSYILQPVYRLIKLFAQRDDKSSRLVQWFAVGSCCFSMFALYFAAAGQNILFVFSCLIIMEVFTLLGASCTKETFGAMAAQRGITRFIVTCFTFIISAATLYRACGTLNLGEIQSFSTNHPILSVLPLTFLSIFVVLLIKGSLMHFDFGITGKDLTFLGTALYTPYSCWSLAVTQITRWVETGVLLKLLAVFLPMQPWLSFAGMALLLLCALLLDNFVSKSQWKAVARNAWIWAGGMSVMNYIWMFLF